MEVKIEQGKTASDLLYAGVKGLADVVGSTLGPKGQTVIIERELQSPIITKDGVTVAKEVHFEDPIMELGCQIVKDVAIQTNKAMGDGTTTATVIAESIIKRAIDLRNAYEQTVMKDVIAGIKKGTELVVSALKQEVVDIHNDVNMVQEVATISANNDVHVGNMIATAVEAVNFTGIVTVEAGDTLDTELTIKPGLSFDRGYLSSQFVTDLEKMEVVYENVLILLYNEVITKISDILPILELANNKKQPLLIIADDIKGEALDVCIINKVRLGLNVVLVKAPGYKANRTELLYDIGSAIGAVVIDPVKGYKITDVVEANLGFAQSITITADETLIVDGKRDKAAVESRVIHIENKLNAEKHPVKIRQLKERIAKLTTGVAIISVGGRNETIIGELKDRYDDAINATQAAIRGGVVIGGGAALFMIADKISQELISANEDVLNGIRLLCGACQAPYFIMLDNAKVDIDIDEKIRIVRASRDENKHYSYQTGASIDYMENMIVDPVDVTISALENAAAVAQLILTTNAIIYKSK